ncbi:MULTISPECIES: hypothetical protein [Paraburkholderia]|jgi:surface antigen|uniref:Surface antigen n=1 Tax=Paraburkholderia hospita TaxID=169430 RepID=A0AAN1MKC6_9BURK|nr:hypothetical protein [Paraburkholderia hospita]AUT70224.1 hypothetical protein C2L64_09980 [Paraburkholderia hospita]SEI26403.1 Surface antigen [Paraburkholderia hospita]
MRTLFGLGATLCVCAGCAVPASPPVAAQEALNDQMICRNIVGQAEIDGTTQQISGLACQQPDGTWQIQQGGDAAAVVYPIPAYPYYDPWYWGPPVAVGFGAPFVFVDRFHHFHHMNHVHWGRPGGGFHGTGGMHGWGGGHTWGGMGGMGGGHRR